VREAATRVPIVWAANTSLGINLYWGWIPLSCLLARGEKIQAQVGATGGERSLRPHTLRRVLWGHHRTIVRGAIQRIVKRDRYGSPPASARGLPRDVTRRRSTSSIYGGGPECTALRSSELSAPLAASNRRHPRMASSRAVDVDGTGSRSAEAPCLFGATKNASIAARLAASGFCALGDMLM